MKRHFAILPVALALLCVGSIANASLMGDAVDIWRGTDHLVFYSKSKIVDETIEVVDDCELFTVDLAENSITFESITDSTWRFTACDNFSPGANFYEWRFTDLDFGGGAYITGLDLSNFEYDPSIVSFTAHSLTLDIDNFIPSNWERGASWTIGFETSPAAPVPEPATMVLLGSGLIGLMGIGRRRLRRG